MPGFSMDEGTPLLSRGGGVGNGGVPMINRIFGGGARVRSAALVRRRSMRPRDVEAVRASPSRECLKSVLAELEANEGVSRWYIALGLFCILNHFAGGVVSMMYLEGWDIFDAAYFCVVTLTTVGYGDLSPSNPTSKLFVIYYVVVSIAIVSSYLAYFVGLFIDQQEELLLRRIVAEEQPAADVDTATRCLDPADYGGMAFSVVFLLCVLAGGATLFATLEGYSALDAIYATIISATTVGFGDLHPRHPSTKLSMTIWLVLSTIAVAKVIADFAEARVKSKQRAVTRRVLLATVDSSDLRTLDTNADGKVDWGEYLETMLVKTGKVSNADVQTVRIKFNQLDKDADGCINVETCM